MVGALQLYREYLQKRSRKRVRNSREEERAVVFAMVRELEDEGKSELLEYLSKQDANDEERYRLLNEAYRMLVADHRYAAEQFKTNFVDQRSLSSLPERIRMLAESLHVYDQPARAEQTFMRCRPEADFTAPVDWAQLSFLREDLTEAEALQLAKKIAQTVGKLQLACNISGSETTENLLLDCKTAAEKLDRVLKILGCEGVQTPSGCLFNENLHEPTAGKQYVGKIEACRLIVNQSYARGYRLNRNAVSKECVSIGAVVSGSMAKPMPKAEEILLWERDFYRIATHLCEVAAFFAEATARHQTVEFSSDGYGDLLSALTDAAKAWDALLSEYAIFPYRSESGDAFRPLRHYGDGVTESAFFGKQWTVKKSLCAGYAYRGVIVRKEKVLVESA